jgi:phosphomannomutase/phosphoglucomutase
MVSLLASSKKKVSELVFELPERHIIKDKIVAKKGAEILAALPSLYPDSRIDMTDGVKIFTSNAWALVRASGTEPVIRIIIDAKSPSAGTALHEDLKTRLKSIER